MGTIWAKDMVNIAKEHIKSSSDLSEKFMVIDLTDTDNAPTETKFMEIMAELKCHHVQETS